MTISRQRMILVSYLNASLSVSLSYNFVKDAAWSAVASILNQYGISLSTRYGGSRLLWQGIHFIPGRLIFMATMTLIS